MNVGALNFVKTMIGIIPRDRKEIDDGNDYQASHGEYAETIFG